MLLAVNYHYIAPERHRGRAIYPISTGDFGAQLDELGRSFEFVSRSDVLAAVAGTRSLPERACLITFDDGLRQQVELGLPILEERGIPALFFVCGEPLTERRVLFVHKVHHLREHVPEDELRAVLDVELERDGIDRSSGSRTAAVETYRYDTEEAAELKYLLNVVLGASRSGPIDRIFSARFSEAELSKQLYVSEEQVRALERKDALGAHTYTHRALAVLEPHAAREDMERGAAVLEGVTGARPLALTYPYGEFVAVSRSVAEEAARAGFAFALTMERALNWTLADPLLLGRLDTNDVPGGRNPLFTVSGESVVFGEGMTAGRTWYMEEIVA